MVESQRNHLEMQRNWLEEFSLVLGLLPRGFPDCVGSEMPLTHSEVKLYALSVSVLIDRFPVNTVIICAVYFTAKNTC